jgi:TBC1 domain family member 2
MNCLLLRELPLKAILRLWDTYLSEETGGFENFHVYVCAVLLKTFKEKLMAMVSKTF